MGQIIYCQQPFQIECFSICHKTIINGKKIKTWAKNNDDTDILKSKRQRNGRSISERNAARGKVFNVIQINRFETCTIQKCVQELDLKQKCMNFPVFTIWFFWFRRHNLIRIVMIFFYRNLKMYYQCKCLFVFKTDSIEYNDIANCDRVSHDNIPLN